MKCITGVTKQLLSGSITAPQLGSWGIDDDNDDDCNVQNMLKFYSSIHCFKKLKKSLKINQTPLRLAYTVEIKKSRLSHPYGLD